MTRAASRAVTMADVGAAAGVTARTVSNVLSGKANVRPETRDAVLRSAHNLGYQLNLSARGLRTGRTGFITLAIPELGIDYFAELAQSVMREAERLDLTVIIQQTGGDRRRELDILSGPGRQLSDGLLFQPHALSSADERMLVGGRPLVLLGERIFSGPVDHVTMANVEAASAATQYLIDHGYRDIAAIGSNPKGGPISAAELRLSGYRDTLERNGIAFNPQLVGVAAEWHQFNGAQAMAAILRTNPRIDAVFCFNDTLAFGALQLLAQQGRRVPEDVAVIGFDNVTAAQYSNPALTTIDPGRAQVARTAVNLLADRINGVSAPQPTETVTDFSLVVRRSA